MARNGGGTQYQEITPGVGAPQVAMPGGPVRMDPAVAGAGWKGLAEFGEGVTKYAEALQKAADLNTVALKRSEYGKRVGEAFAAFSNSVDGSNPMEDMRRWGEIHESIKYETTKDVSGGAAPALKRYFAEHEETFNGKARESVYKAVEKRSGMTLDSNLADKVALGMQTTNNLEREQYLLEQYKLADAQVEAGLLSPIDAEIRKVKDRQQYYADVFRGDLLKPNWRDAYDQWQQDKPVDSQGNTWKRLVGKDGIAALERMSQTIFAERTRESVRLAEKRETEGITLLNRELQSSTARLARSGSPEDWEAHRQRVLANPHASPETIRGVESRPEPLDATPETRAAKDTVKGAYTEMTRKYDPKYREKEREDLDELHRRIQAGEKPVDAAAAVRKARTVRNSPPAGFSGDATPQSLSAYEQAIVARVARGDIKQQQADQLIARARQWVSDMQNIGFKR
jgi:hypothetical protein